LNKYNLKNTASTSSSKKHYGKSASNSLNTPEFLQITRAGVEIPTGQ
jgi:hypothetical protein